MSSSPGGEWRVTEAFPTVEGLLCKKPILFVVPGLEGGVREAKTWETSLLSRSEETRAR